MGVAVPVLVVCVGVGVVEGVADVPVAVGVAVAGVVVPVGVAVQGNGGVGTGSCSVRELFCSLLSATALFGSTTTVIAAPVEFPYPGKKTDLVSPIANPFTVC